MVEYRNSKIFGDNWAWRSDDSMCWRFFNKHTHWINGFAYHSANIPREIVELIPENKRNCVIQAGGNAGLYPKIYSEYFKEVNTFEPDDEWRECLRLNCTEQNIICRPVCLGDKISNVSLIAPPGKGGRDNLGALHINPKVKGEIPVITIDSLELVPDLIHLDIEGYEAMALIGATETIKKHRPIIVIETNNSGDKFGWTDKRVISLIETFGYKMIFDWQHDKAFAPL